MKDLREHLDERPVNFDREALWKKIKKPQKRRRIIPFIWLGVLILIGSTTYVFMKTISPQQYKVTHTEIINEKPINGIKKIKKQDRITSKEELVVNPSNIPTELEATVIKTKKSVNSSSSFTTSTKQSKNKDLSSDASDKTQVGSHTATNAIEPNEHASLSIKISERNTDLRIEKLEIKTKLLQLPFVTLEDLEYVKERKTKFIKQKNSLPWSIVFQVSLGSHSNDIQELTDRKIDFETPYINHGYSVALQKGINKNVFVELFAGYQILQEKLSHKTITEKTFFRLDNIQNEITTSFYNYYNRFQFMQIGTSLGFEKKFQTLKFEIIPQFTFNYLFNKEGHYLNENMMINELAEVSYDRVALQFSLSSGVSFPIKDALFLQIRGSLSTSLSVSTDQNYSHEFINPYTIQVGIGKSF